MLWWESLPFVWIMLNPSLSNQLNSLIFRLQNGVPDTQTIINTFLPFLLNPVVIFLGFATISVLVPIIEETFKPLGVWFLAGQKITPAQGFGFGVLSGAAFGLFENLGNTSSGGTDWALLAAHASAPCFCIASPPGWSDGLWHPPGPSDVTYALLLALPSLSSFMDCGMDWQS